MGAPRIRVLAGAEPHVTIDRSLRLLGLGTTCLEIVPVDRQGRMRADALLDALAASDRPTIVCARAGNVNTGAFDPVSSFVDACRNAGAWLQGRAAMRISVSSFRTTPADVERSAAAILEAAAAVSRSRLSA